ncbi:hypothetical protein ASE66_24870 [Bosea sp. Root483D1]|nr:hypothetical protein ASE66_24870 [Bosea sp. Root483D1]
MLQHRCRLLRYSQASLLDIGFEKKRLQSDDCQGWKLQIKVVRVTFHGEPKDCALGRVIAHRDTPNIGDAK